jgi:hypothetical protein
MNLRRDVLVLRTDRLVDAVKDADGVTLAAPAGATDVDPEQAWVVPGVAGSRNCPPLCGLRSWGCQCLIRRLSIVRGMTQRRTPPPT